MNYKTLAVSVFMFAIANISMASTLSRPNKCPEVTSIQAVANELKVKKWDRDANVWYAYMNNNFKTKYEWTFIIGEVVAKNDEYARQKLTSALAGLHFSGGADGDDGSVECKYYVTGGLHATAINPPWLNTFRRK